MFAESCETSFSSSGSEGVASCGKGGACSDDVFVCLLEEELVFVAGEEAGTAGACCVGAAAAVVVSLLSSFVIVIVVRTLGAPGVGRFGHSHAPSKRASASPSALSV